MIKAVPISLGQCADFIKNNHRRHQPLKIDKYRIGAEIDGILVGVVQVNRPVSRVLDDGKTLEVCRLCVSVDGEGKVKNVCSFLYARAARIAREMGYTKIISYISHCESGVSLIAAGWRKEADVKGHSWNAPSRPRIDKHPITDKQRWSKIL
jgi:hypothetical protein